VRATGTGCFFDDPTHEVPSLKGRSYQTFIMTDYSGLSE
jgi:hypothetical protein